MSIDGIWVCEVAGIFGWERVSTVYLEKGRYLGGGADIFSHGTYVTDGKRVKFKLSVTQHGNKISIFGEKREAAICRELTKLHEEISSASLAELSQLYENRKVKGEIVIIVGATSSEDKIDIDALLTELMETMSVSPAASEAANLSGRAKRDLYQRALKLSGK